MSTRNGSAERKAQSDSGIQSLGRGLPRPGRNSPHNEEESCGRPGPSSAAPFKTVHELIDYAKAHPGKLNWANAGSGFQSHLAGVLLTHMAGIDVLHVPYKGAGASLSAVIAGESQVTIVPAPSVMGHVRAGLLRALAMGGEKRSPIAPELPTIMEAGVPGYISTGWAGFLVPSKTPAAIRNKLYDTVVQAVKDPQTNAALVRLGAEPMASMPAELAAVIKRDWKAFGDAIRVAGIKPD